MIYFPLSAHDPLIYLPPLVHNTMQDPTEDEDDGDLLGGSSNIDGRCGMNDGPSFSLIGGVLICGFDG